MNTKNDNLVLNKKPFHRINKFYLGGFKAFKDVQEFSIRPITFVIGPNSSGKSSLLKGLTYALEGKSTNSVDIGRFWDFVNAKSVLPTIGFSFNEKNVVNIIDRTDLFVGLMNDSLSWDLPLDSKEFTEKVGDEFRRRMDEFDISPHNYNVNHDCMMIKYEADTGWDLDVYDLDLPFYTERINSKDINDETVKSYGNYESNIPLRFRMTNKNITGIESSYMNLLFERISDCYQEIGMSDDDISYHLNCIKEEIANLNVKFDADKGRLYIEELGTNTAWDLKCRNYFYEHAEKSIEDSVPEKILEARKISYSGWIERQIKEFNSRNYDEIVRTKEDRKKNPFYTNSFISMISDDAKLLRRRKNKLSKKRDGNGFIYGNNIYVKFKIVYSAVFAIISDINIRYFSAFASLSPDNRPTIKYIPAQRSFLDNQGNVTKSWESLIIGDENRELVNQWLSIFTENFRISNPVKMYTEKQVSELISGAVKIDDITLIPTMDSTLRIEDKRVPEKRFRPQDVGFGIQKLLPVIAASVFDHKKSTVFKSQHIDIIAIEEPEMHLHPKLQSDLGDLFVDNVINCSEKSFLIETHSEHLLLRVLKRVRDGDLSSSAVSVLYIHPGNGDSGAYVEHLDIDEEGEFLKPWPPGFFDVRRKNLI